MQPITDDMFDAIYSSFLDDGDRFLTKDDWRHLFSPSKATDGCCGYALLDKDQIVGILGMLFSYRTVRGVERRFCNLHSWYVLPAYRGKSLALMRPALRLQDCTLTDLTPTDAVCEITQRLGFQPLDSRLRILAPMPAGRIERSASLLTGEEEILAVLNESERRLYADHMHRGLGHLVVQSDNCYCYVIFAEVRRYRVPYAHVHYINCRERFAKHQVMVRRHLTRSTNARFAAVDERLVRETRLLFSFRLPFSTRQMFRPAGVSASDVDSLYTEVSSLCLSTFPSLSHSLMQIAGKLRPWGSAKTRSN